MNKLHLANYQGVTISGNRITLNFSSEDRIKGSCGITPKDKNPENVVNFYRHMYKHGVNSVCKTCRKRMHELFKESQRLIDERKDKKILPLLNEKVGRGI